MKYSQSFWATALAATLLSAPFLSYSQDLSQLTPEQRQKLEQLTPEQRQKLLEEMKKGGIKQDAPLTQPSVATPRPAAETSAPSSPEVKAKEALKPATLAETQETQQVQEKLHLFGYNLFRDVPTTFAPATDIPVPATYIIGPGDTIRVQLYGKEGGDYSLVVGRDGQLNFPGLGPISVSGLRYGEMESLLLKRVSEQMIGVKAAIAMGPLRSIQVFILGDAVRPGSYTISALSTMTNALFVSGGVKEIGSLRDIQLKRNGRVVRRLDLYDLLLQGDTSADVRLQPGDVLFIPPIGPTTGVAGEVRRPAIYELRDERSAKDLIRIAGGLLPTAYPKASQVERIDEAGNRTIIDADLTQESGQALAVRDGDVITVYSILDKQENIILLSGHVQRPGGYQWSAGMRLLDLVPKVGDLLPTPDLKYVVIKREVQPQRYIEVMTTRYDLALENPESPFNLELKPRDEVIFMGVTTDHAARLAAITSQLREQATLREPEKVVSIRGHVTYPGSYPLTTGMRISDLLRAAAEPRPETDFGYAILSRELADRRIEVQSVRLREVVAQPAGEADFELRPRDELYIFSLYGNRGELVEPLVAGLRKQATAEELSPEVSVGGSTRHAGTFPLIAGMRVSDLLKVSGAFNQAAFLVEAELTRYQVDKGQRIEIGHQKVDLAGVLAGTAEADTLLQPYDHLLVKQISQWRDPERVEIRGEVQFPGSYVIKKGETLQQLLKRAGGFTDQAYPFGAVFLREELRKREQEQIEIMRDRLRADVAAAALQNLSSDPQKQESFALAQGLLAQLETAQAVGRMAINLPELLAEDDEGDVELRNGDRLLIPRKPQEVTVIGEVNFPTSHLYERGENADSYIDRSGGTTYKADEGRVYVVRANGEVTDVGGWWSGGRDMEPGDTIVVPLDAERVKPLFLWSSIVQIVYQMGLATAAFHAVGVF